MSIFNILCIILLLGASNICAKNLDKSNYINNPDFLGIWEEKNYQNGKLLKIQKVNIENSKYNYVLKQKKNNFLIKDKMYTIKYVAFIQGNSLEAINRQGKIKKFYILKTGILTDLDQYYMIRKKP